MEVHLTSEQAALIRGAIQSGRVKNAEDAVYEALLLWEERERRRAENLAALDSAEASLARGEGRPITEEPIRHVAGSEDQRPCTA